VQKRAAAAKPEVGMAASARKGAVPRFR
jgi:hypothetical protein